jgi:hypothetical protein
LAIWRGCSAGQDLRTARRLTPTCLTTSVQPRLDAGARKVALQALLVDPVVTSVRAAEATLDTILRRPSAYRG